MKGLYILLIVGLLPVTLSAQEPDSASVARSREARGYYL